MAKNREKIYSTIKMIIAAFYELIMTSMIMLLILPLHASYAYKKEFDFPNIILLIGGILVLISAVALCNKLGKSSNARYGWISKISIIKVSVILFLVQVYICYNIYFGTGWDVGSEIIPSAKLIAENAIGQIEHGYFSRYPNNILIVRIFSDIFKINNAFGILDTENGLMSIIVLQCMLNSITGYIIFKILNQMNRSNKVAWGVAPLFSASGKFAMAGYYIF